jgi:hypothetical protein
LGWEAVIRFVSSMPQAVEEDAKAEVDPVTTDGETIRLGRAAHVAFDAEKVRLERPNPNEVLVIAIGSYYIRFGNASAPVPHKIRNIAAIQKDPGRATVEPVRAHRHDQEATGDTGEDVENTFAKAVDEIAAATFLSERRRGGGKPIPWKVEVEAVDVDAAPEEELNSETVRSAATGRAVFVGRAAERISLDNSNNGKFQVITPVVDGRMAWDPEISKSMVRSGLDLVLLSVARQFHASLKGLAPEATGDDHAKTKSPSTSDTGSRNADASTHVALIVPESSDRADVAEFVSAVFRVDELRAGAVFVHHNAVSCALGAGLSNCVVLDIGHSATTIACVEEGCVLGDSKVHLRYGARNITAVFDKLLRKSGSFDKICGGKSALGGPNVDHAGSAIGGADAGLLQDVSLAADDMQAISRRACEQLCGFSVEENGTLSVAMIRAPSSGKMFRIKCGVGIRAIPAYGLVYPGLFEAVSKIRGYPLSRLAIPRVERNSGEDNAILGLFDDVKRSAVVTGAIPFGLFANEADGVAGDTDNAVHPWRASVVEALAWSVNRAIGTSAALPTESHRIIELQRRYFKSILLAGGGSSIDGIALALESSLKRLLESKAISVGDVTVIDGAKGKGDEELLAATAVLRADGVSGLDDDGDPASLAWKGGAVMVEADAVKDLWVYRDEWMTRDVRALRERAPFYW